MTSPFSGEIKEQQAQVQCRLYRGRDCFDLISQGGSDMREREGGGAREGEGGKETKGEQGR
eukprot:3359486-Rhodomonas_salina.1